MGRGEVSMKWPEEIKYYYSKKGYPDNCVEASNKMLEACKKAFGEQPEPGETPNDIAFQQGYAAGVKAQNKIQHRKLYEMVNGKVTGTWVATPNKQLVVQDASIYGQHIEKDGKRVDPKDFYKEQPAGLVPQELKEKMWKANYKAVWDALDQIWEAVNDITPLPSQEHIQYPAEPSSYAREIIIALSKFGTRPMSTVELDEKLEDSLCKLIEDTEKEYDRQCREGWPKGMIKKSRAVVRAVHSKLTGEEKC